MAKQSTKLVTRESLELLLASTDRNKVIQVVGRALVVINNNQTKVEQDAVQTLEHNGIGFTSGDAKGGTLTAKYFKRHNTLLDWQLEKWLRVTATGTRLGKYHAQLNKEAIRLKEERMRKECEAGMFINQPVKE